MIDFQNGQNSGWREMHNSEIQQDKSPDIIKDTKGEKEDVGCHPSIIIPFQFFNILLSMLMIST